MRTFIELTYAGDGSPISVATEEIQSFTPPPSNSALAGVGCIVTLVDCQIHVKENYSDVKRKTMMTMN